MERKYVLVTGATTGIGRATTHRLTRDGFTVFATVRRPGDAEGLGKIPGVVPLLMDVTNPGQIEQAAAEVIERTGDRGLTALVNNAGIGVFEPLETVAPQRFREQLAVNVSGQLEVTQRLLPAIRMASGRILVMGSLAGRLTLPYAGPQSIAKHAIAALADALRQELAPWSIPVILIEPAVIRTEAVDKLRHDTDNAVASFDEEQRNLYATTFTGMMTRARKQAEHGSPAELVADAISAAIESGRPRHRYPVGKNSRVLATLARMPARVRDGLLRRMFALPAPGSLAERPAGDLTPARAARPARRW